MDVLKYLGHEFQLFGKEEYVLNEGKAKGMRIWHVKNGLGLELCISLDRGFDIVSVTYKGTNVNYITPNGYVNNNYYDDKGAGFLKSFTGGFLTTCGLNNVGSPNIDEGQELPLHGTYSNIPSINQVYEDKGDYLLLKADILDEGIFSYKLKLTRVIKVSKVDNTFTIDDEVINRGDDDTPVEILYHMNFGYPLLSEHSILTINSIRVEGRDALASSELDMWSELLPPTPKYIERCYFHYFDDVGEVKLYSPIINKGVKINFDSKNLPFFCEWKMMGVRDYVLGLEPGNCTPEGRNIMREKGLLTILKPNEKKNYHVKITLFEGE